MSEEKRPESLPFVIYCKRCHGTRNWHTQYDIPACPHCENDNRALLVLYATHPFEQALAAPFAPFGPPIEPKPAAGETLYDYGCRQCGKDWQATAFNGAMVCPKCGSRNVMAWPQTAPYEHAHAIAQAVVERMQRLAPLPTAAWLLGQAEQLALLAGRFDMSTSASEELTAIVSGWRRAAVNLAASGLEKPTTERPKQKQHYCTNANCAHFQVPVALDWIMYTQPPGPKKCPICGCALLEHADSPDKMQAATTPINDRQYLFACINLHEWIGPKSREVCPECGRYWAVIRPATSDLALTQHQPQCVLASGAAALNRPQPAPLTQDQLQALCREWQGILRLQDWDVTVDIVSPKDFKGEAHRPHSGKRWAKFLLADPSTLPEAVTDPYDPEVTLVHELLHLHLWETIDTVENLIDQAGPAMKPLIHLARQTMNDVEERAVSTMARVLVRLKRGGQSG